MNEKDNTWFERGELPPVGIECEMMHEGVWIKCKPIGFDGEGLVCKLHVTEGKGINIKFMPCYSCKFRPIRTEREKAIEAATQAFHAKCMHDYSGQPFLDGLGALYDAGLLRLPEEGK